MSEEFQKTVLWQLAGIRAENNQLKHQLGLLCELLTRENAKELTDSFQKETEQSQKIFYRRMLDEVGLVDEDLDGRDN